MSRPVFSFRPNPGNPEHQRAWEILKNVPEGQKSQFLVGAILNQDRAFYLEETIRRAVREEMKGIRLEQNPAQAGAEAGKQEIPDQMLDFLSRME